MPEHLRALPVVLIIAAATFMLARPHIAAAAMSAQDFARRRNLWFAVTLAAFLTHNIWAFVVLSAGVLLFAGQREPNRVALFLFLLLAVPALSAQISGFGLINYFFAVHYVRVLVLALLLPAALALWMRPDVERFGSTLPDKLLIAYLLVLFFLQLQVDTFTNTLRSAVFYAAIDIVLPYFVASRALRDLRELRDAAAAFVMAAMVAASLAVFELLKHWNLYFALERALGASWSMGSYSARPDGLLRAQASVGGPIPLGYVLAIALGLYAYLWTLIPSRLWRWLGLGVLVAGLAATQSRGPWIGALVMALVFAGSARASIGRAAAFCTASLAALVFLVTTDDVADYVPFARSIDEGSVVYRQRLVEIALEEILKNPWFGSFYLYAPAFEELRQGQGIIDIVNTYVGVGLSSGLVGLSLFCGFFLAVLWRVYRGLIVHPGGGDEAYRSGRAMVAVLSGILLIIFTVSSISLIPLLYWTFAGVGMACARLLHEHAARAGNRTRMTPAWAGVRG